MAERLKIKKPIPIGITALSLLGAVVLSIESYLNIQNQSLCKTVACEVVGNYIRISEPLLTAGGALFFWLLTLTLFFSYRYPKQLGLLPVQLLLPALAFDGVLIGFQFITIQQQCALCIGVALFLTLLTLFFLLHAGRKLLAICSILIWISSFAASSIITMPEPQNAYSRMILYAKSSEASADTIKQSKKMTLVFSMQCPHCLQVIDYLSHQDISETTWQFAATDQDNKSLLQLKSFLNQVSQADNPFKLLRTIKIQPPAESGKLPTTILKKDKTTLAFLSNLSIHTVPVLIVEKSNSEKQVITNSSAILNFLSRSYN